MSRKVIFLDRDGTINVDYGHVHRSEDWEFIDGAVEAIRLLRRAGYAVAVVTNQSGIAAGRFGLDDLLALHEHLQQELRRLGAAVDALAYCPHAASDGCRCRKPQTALADQVAAQLGQEIDYASSWMVGDKPSDVWFGAALEMETILLPSRYWSADDLGCEPTLLVASLREAAERIIATASD